jgi:group II intron reverse transcriptase/maturase
MIVERRVSGQIEREGETMTVHSTDGKTWLTKLDRISVLSAANKAMTFNNVGYLINAGMLKELYHQLSGRKAVGIDRVTKEEYGEKLDENIKNLITRIRRGTYKPKPARITEIPKEDGSTRPLAISCFEDKLVQLAVNTILTSIYEPLFLSCSYGFRPNRNCHDALRALTASVFPNANGALVEIDIQKYFNTIPHAELEKILRNKISDKRFLRLILTLMKTPILVGKEVKENTCGSAQGSIASPLLANVYLHHVIDEWFESIKHTHIHGRAELIRFADDMVFAFEKQSEAERFFCVLPKRLSKYGLTLHVDKSQIIPAGRFCAQRAHAQGKRLPTFNFLGFTGYWAKSRKGHWRLKFTSRRDRFAAKLKSLRKFLWDNLSTKKSMNILDSVVLVIRGWINYHNISDNAHKVETFRNLSARIIYQWINRKGRRHPMRWDTFNLLLKAIEFPRAGKVISMFPCALKRMGPNDLSGAGCGNSASPVLKRS